MKHNTFRKIMESSSKKWCPFNGDSNMHNDSVTLREIEQWRINNLKE